jgi:hypothetical protein
VVAGVAAGLGVTGVPMSVVVAIALLQRVEVVEVLLRLLGEVLRRGPQGVGEGPEPDCLLLGGLQVFSDVSLGCSTVSAPL